MKKKKPVLSPKLILNKFTITELSVDEQAKLAGGVTALPRCGTTGTQRPTDCTATPGHTCC
ncbi:class I lanthipeptide [Chitinophaga qingshengii]|uniref:Class I lanthipeptide n=1 Tax=Chitinophaga qingshengii TaxID=1569794 RepID=A0ABR7TNC1_9BACT|nr:class I lanthipeptide [Chitinophaga qingshengii]MBC9931485.1 class I lanthipeptide [Chitinophaga qingshengii]